MVIYFDLDDTLWNFKANANDTFQEMYDKYGFERYFDSKKQIIAQ